ncbi:UNVERIFIED_CONTAM: hypothetical protein FKN15_070329 [Acipenser sinensis]
MFLDQGNKSAHDKQEHVLKMMYRCDEGVGLKGGTYSWRGGASALTVLQSKTMQKLHLLLTLCCPMSDLVRHCNYSYLVQCRTLSDIIKKTRKIGF